MSKLTTIDESLICPCREIESKKCLYKECCGPIHHHQAWAKTAERLMRSRYSAFALTLYPYLVETHHISTRGNLSIAQLEASNIRTRWLGLKILITEEKKVSFQAYFLQGKEIACLHEDSNFIKDLTERESEESGNMEIINDSEGWYYLNGRHNPALAKLPKRRELCFCGSRKKYKNCHCP